MRIFPSKNIEKCLVLLVSNTKLALGPEQAHGTIHEIVKTIFKDWLESTLVYRVVEYFVVRCNLNSNVSFNIENLSSYVNCVVNPPDFPDIFR